MHATTYNIALNHILYNMLYTYLSYSVNIVIIISVIIIIIYIYIYIYMSGWTHPAEPLRDNNT